MDKLWYCWYQSEVCKTFFTFNIGIGHPPDVCGGGESGDWSCGAHLRVEYIPSPGPGLLEVVVEIGHPILEPLPSSGRWKVLSVF